MLTQERKQKRPILYIFIVSERGKLVIPIWIMSKADVIERLPRIPGSSHAFLISWYDSFKGFLFLGCRSFQYSVFNLEPHKRRYELATACNSATSQFCSFDESGSLGFQRLMHQGIMMTRESQLAATPACKYGRSKGIRGPVKQVANKCTWSLNAKSDLREVVAQYPEDGGPPADFRQCFVKAVTKFIGMEQWPSYYSHL